MDTSSLAATVTVKDLFILHAGAELDTRFVRTYLLPSLKLPPDRLILSSSLPPGRPVLHAVEQALACCRVTVLIVSPAFLRETWSTFGEALAGFHAMRGGLLVPLLISDCELPLRLELWVRLDFRSEDQRESELARLLELVHPAACRRAPAVDLARDADPDEAVISLPMPAPEPPQPRRPPRIRITRARLAVAGMVSVLSGITLLRAPHQPLEELSTEEPPLRSTAAHRPEAAFLHMLLVSAQSEAPSPAPQRHRELRPPPADRSLKGLMARGDVKRIRTWLRQGKPYKPLLDDARAALARRDYARALRWGKLIADTVEDPDAAWICAQAYVAQDRADLAEPYLQQSDPANRATLVDEPADDRAEPADGSADGKQP